MIPASVQIDRKRSRRDATAASSTPANAAQADPSDRPDPTFRALARTFGLLKRVAEAHFNPFGISPSQWGILITLHRANLEGLGGLRLTDLGDRLLVRPPSVTGVVERLERMGLILREQCNEDARAKRVNLTLSGKQLVARVLVTMPDHVESILADLSASDRQTFRGLLERISSRLEIMNASPAEHAGEPARALAGAEAR